MRLLEQSVDVPPHPPGLGAKCELVCSLLRNALPFVVIHSVLLAERIFILARRLTKYAPVGLLTICVGWLMFCFVSKVDTSHLVVMYTGLNGCFPC